MFLSHKKTIGNGSRTNEKSQLEKRKVKSVAARRSVCVSKQRLWASSLFLCYSMKMPSYQKKKKCLSQLGQISHMKEEKQVAPICFPSSSHNKSSKLHYKSIFRSDPPPGWMPFERYNRTLMPV